MENHIGFRHVTFGVENLSELSAELQGKGFKFVLPEKETRRRVRVAMVQDPDGNIVEFVERSW